MAYRFPAVLFLTLILQLVLFVTASAQEEEQVVRVDSSIVVMNATITDANGKPVFGLKQNHFKIFEDGIEQEISLFTTEETPFAAVILLDTSGSMEERVSLARAAAIRFLDGLRESDNSAIYRFDSKVKLVQKFSGSRDIDQDIFDIKSEGMTALNDAVYLAAAELSNRPEKRRAIVVLSDGEDTFSKKSADKALRAALAANAVIYTVDMSPVDTNGNRRTQNRGVLKNFAEKTGGIFVSTPGGAAMRDAFKAIVEDLGTQYTLGYQPTNSAKDGKWRALELRVAKPKLRIRTREGYNAEKSN
ncbi:MAG TPA: VWA domain-containing protein [Pyrinomonadaceae bacterium]|nr:VWA domain-containing protein [Pyrinomonadaceae bacterium]